MRFFGYILILLPAFQAAQLEAPESLVAGCVVELELPNYPSLARQARLEGILKAEVKISASGRADGGVEVSGAHPLFINAVRRALVEASFRKTCAGRTLGLTFEFRLVGPPTAFSLSRIRMVGDGAFRIETRPSVVNE